MALVLADRVRETTTVVGTGPATLLGAIVGYQSFTAVGNGNTTYYVIANQSAGEWEVGVGTYTASGTTLSRDTVLSSSNAGALVVFSAGTKDIWVDYAAGKAVTTDTLAYPPAIGNTTPNAATFTTLTATGQTSLGGAAGSESFRASVVASSVNWIQAEGGVAGVGPILRSTGSDTNVDFLYSTKGTGGSHVFRTNSTVRQFQVNHTASAVNYVQVTGAATGGPPAITAQGSDAAIALLYVAKGGQDHRFFSNSGNAEQFRVIHTAGTMVNQTTATGSATGVAPAFSVRGSDTNIDLALTPKGTGNVVATAGQIYQNNLSMLGMSLIMA